MNFKIQKAYELRESGDVDGAEKLCSEVLNETPHEVDALFCFGLLLITCERFGMAANIFARCVQLQPNSHEALSNFALSLLSMNEFNESEQVLHRVLKQHPDYCPALNNMALLKVNQVNPKAALEYGIRSLAINPNQADVLESMGYAKLMLGDWDGWSGYEAMINTSKFRKHKPLGKEPYWEGQKNGRLYVKGEQGIGDEISFSSILEDARKDNDIILDCDPKLEGLFRRSFPEIEVYGTRNSPQKPWKNWRTIDYSCLIGSLASHYRLEDKQFPGKPFLIADPDRVTQWKALLNTLPGQKIGIAWTGGSKNTFSARRSMSLEDMLPILKTPNVTWVSLQYKDPSSEIRAFERKHGIKIHHWKRGPESSDYDDVAALVKSLDCVVSVTTAAVHLCGGLGVKCFALVPSKPRWFYQVSGTKSPWYDSIELCRQGQEWNLELVKDKLTKYLDQYDTFKQLMEVS